MRASRYMSRSLVVLPLMLAVLLVSVCIPSVCSAATMAAGGCPDCATAPNHAMPFPWHAGSAHETAPTTCNHSTGSTVQASSPDQQTVRFTDVVASLPAVGAPVLASAVVLRPVAQEPSPPPGVVLTASQLRI